MNFLSHGYLYLEDPWFLVGTAVPDWTPLLPTAVRWRAREVRRQLGRHAEPYDSLARGILRHLDDDAWFHSTPAFLDLCREFTESIRAVTGPEERIRPSFLAHIGIELLLDACLTAEDPERLPRYYATLESLDGGELQRGVEAIAGAPVGLAELYRRFLRSRFLEDYATDEGLCHRLDQVLGRVGLARTTTGFRDILPALRRRVNEERERLLPPAGAEPQAQQP